jgi:hypothetical protein
MRIMNVHIASAQISSKGNSLLRKRARRRWPRGRNIGFSLKIPGAALVLALALLAGCDGGDLSVVASPSRSGFFLSDLHFNPLADPAIANRLAQAPASQWDAIFATSTETAYSLCGCRNGWRVGR